MIVFTNTRTEESSSLSLFSTQFLSQNYSYSANSNQFYKIGPRGVAVSIGACGGFFATQEIAPTNGAKNPGKASRALKLKPKCGDGIKGIKWQNNKKRYAFFVRKGTTVPLRSPQIALGLGSNPDEGPFSTNGENYD